MAVKWYLLTLTCIIYIKYTHSQKCGVLTAYQPNLHVESSRVTFDTFKSSKQEFIKILSDNSTLSINSKLLRRNKFDKYVIRTYIYDSWLNLIDLSNNGISTIENDAFSEIGGCLQYIYLCSNQIERIDKTAFTYLQQLRKLDLSNNKISTIESFAFNQTNLDILILSKNRLFNLTKDIFYNLNNLTYLDLSYNQLTFSNKDNCLQYLQQLKVLNISNNNITVLSINMLIYLSKLIELRLDSNHLKQLPIGLFKNSKSLVVLSLGGNNISTFQIGTFYGLKMLSELNISYNKINEVQEQKLFTLENLKTLHLDGNNITDTINVREIYTHLLKLRTVSIADMAWQCNKLLNVMKQFALRGINVKEHYLPDNVEAMNIKGILCNDTELLSNVTADVTSENNTVVGDNNVDSAAIKSNNVYDILIDENRSIFRLLCLQIVLSVAILVAVFKNDIRNYFNERNKGNFMSSCHPVSEVELLNSQ